MKPLRHDDHVLGQRARGLFQVRVRLRGRRLAVVLVLTRALAKVGVEEKP